MSYYRALARALRGRRLPEHRVAELLDEVRELSAESGQPPQEAFGLPSEYAAQFPSGRARSAGRTIMNLAGVLTLALLVGDLVLKAQGRADVTGALPGSFVLFGVLCAGVVLGSVVDSRVPAGVRRALADRPGGSSSSSDG